MRKPKNWIIGAIIAALAAVITYLQTGVALP